MHVLFFVYLVVYVRNEWQLGGRACITQHAYDHGTLVFVCYGVFVCTYERETENEIIPESRISGFFVCLLCVYYIDIVCLIENTSYAILDSFFSFFRTDSQYSY